MNKEKIKRINELAKKSKEIALTDDEKTEQKLLRDEYRGEFKKSFLNTLNNTYVEDEKGNKQKLIK